MIRHVFWLWSLILFTALVDAVWLAIAGMALTPQALLLIFFPVLGLLGVARFYSTIRINPRIASLAHMVAATLAFMSSTCILSYLMVTLRRPLVDAELIAADHALGLTWLDFYTWMKARPVLHIGMQFVYMSLIPQIFILQIILNSYGKIARAWETLGLFAAVCVACVLCSGLWPAVGAFASFHVQPNEPYVREFAALRDGTLKLIGSHGGLQGVVEFPSLHMALAVLLPYAARGIRVVFPVFLMLDILVMITTAPVGGHHYADLWAGAILAGLAIAASRLWFPEKSFEPPKTAKRTTKGGAQKKAGRA